MVHLWGDENPITISIKCPSQGAARSYGREPRYRDDSDVGNPHPRSSEEAKDFLMICANKVVLSHTALAYIAGLFDGEGCIIIERSRPYNRATVRHWLHVSIANTNKEVLDWIQECFGGAVRRTGNPRGNRQVCWGWYIKSASALLFLTSLLPYLRIKRAQADIAIQFQIEVSSWQSRQRLPETILIRRQQLRDQLRGMRKAPHC